MYKGRNIWSQLKDRANNFLQDLSGSGAPTNGTSGTGVGNAGPGSYYFDYTNGISYVNIGTLASPYWQSLIAGQVFTKRTRNTTAEVNAGATLLAAIAGWKYRLVDAFMIAIGGNAATATSVDIGATQAAGAVLLVANAVAGLTRSTVLRAGATNSTVLADGASFVNNDVNTAITIGKTGGSLATATHIDSHLLYELVKA